MSLAVAGHAQNVVITGPANPINEGNNGGTVVAPFQVSLDAPASGDSQVFVSTVQGTATAGQDFTAISKQPVNFPKGTMGPITVNVSIIGDNVYEPNSNNNIETFSLAADSATPAANVSTNNASAVAQIRDDDPVPVINISDAAPVTEGNTGTTLATFNLTLSSPAAVDVSATYTVTADANAPVASATPGTDFQTPQQGSTVTFSAGTTTQTITVPIIGDTTDETTESFLVNLSNPVNGQLGNTQARGTITDDDGPRVDITDVTQNEGDRFDFILTLSAPSPEPITINFTTTDQSAISPDDYTKTSGVVTFPANNTQPQQISVFTNQDNLVEGNEFFTVDLSGASGGVTFTRTQAIGTIVDDEDPPIVGISPVAKPEGDTGTTFFPFVVTLSTPSTKQITVHYATSNGNATAGNDYQAASGDLIFAANQTSKSFNVNVIGDTVDEADERFIVTLTLPGNITPPLAAFPGGINQLQTTGTIQNDDGPVITFANTAVSVKEGGSGARPNAIFQVQLSKVSDHAVSVAYTSTQGTTNPATAGSDYTPVSGTLTFDPGTKSKTISVQIKGDAVNEDDETFLVVLSKPVGGTLTAADTATGTILDDDAAPSVSISNFTGNEGNAGANTNFPFTVTLANPSAQTVTVNYATNDISATGGTAAGPGVDYLTTSGTITFNPGVTKQTVNIRVFGDVFDEPTETFSVVLSNPVNSTLPATASGTGTIRDDDAAPQISIVQSAAIVEDTAPVAPATLATLNFGITLDRPSGQDVSFLFNTKTATINSGALRPASGLDYDGAVNFRVTIPAGQTQTVFGVSVHADDIDEYDEYFNVVLSDPINATIKRATSMGIIIDDDDAPTVKIGTPATNATAIEGVQPASFPVTLSDPDGRPVTVFYTISGDGQTNRATPLLDLAPIDDNGKVLLKQNTGFITFAPGQTDSFINIAALADQLNEPTEGFRVTITRVDPSDVGFAAAADATAASTIEDRNSNFASFNRNDGNEDYNGAGNNGTDVVLTGDQFVINGISQVRRVLFSVISNNINKATDASFTVDSDTQITARVPHGALSGRIRIVLINGQILAPTNQGADKVFFVNAIPITFTPQNGVPGDFITVTGINFDDPNNPVVNVIFNGGAAGQSTTFSKVNGKTVIRTKVPPTATAGPLTVRTQNGTNYPPSLDSFGINTVSTGGLRFVGSSGAVVLENESGLATNPPTAIAQYTLQLRPATENNQGSTEVAPRGDVTVRINITEGNATFPFNAADRTSYPQISVSTGRVTFITGTSFDVTFPAGSLADKIVKVVYAGNDSIKPLFSPTRPFSAQTTVPLVLTAAITRSGDSAFYPVAAADNSIELERADIHGIDTNIGINPRTTEDQNSATNRTSFKLNLANINNGVDVAADGKPVTAKGKYTNSPEATVINPDGTVNRDAEPGYGVRLPFLVNDTSEGLIRYYVQVPDGTTAGKFKKVYPAGGVFQPNIVIDYSIDPTSDEYYKYDHFIEAKGVDDLLQDGSQPYQIILDLGTTANPSFNSVDSEYFQLNLVVPFTLTNDDNEQSTGGGEPGFIFSKTTGATNEAGSQDTFKIRLRTQPQAGKQVVLKLQTGDPTEVLFVDPSDTSGNTKVENINITFLPDSNGTNAGKTTTRWDTPITVTVAGVDDSDLDGNQSVNIITSVVSNTAGTLTTDTDYQAIDPSDLTVVNNDNESIGVTVSPPSLTIPEGSSKIFSVKLNTRPTGEVSISFQSSDTNVARANVTGTTDTVLTFTPANYTVAQTVTVIGVSDSAFTPSRTATIVLSPISSDDPTFNGLNPNDVPVTVTNQTQAFIVEPAAVLTSGLTTSEDGGTDFFTVRLPNQPSQPVSLILTTSSGEVTLSSGTQRGSSITLNFSAANFAAQTVTVTGLDDQIADGNVAYNINGAVNTLDPVYSGQLFPSISGINMDNDGTTTNGTVTFAANGTFNVSFPFAASTSADSGLTQSQAFSLASGTGTPQFTLYKFNAAGQRNSRQVNGGSDFVVVPASEKLVRGAGYRLVTGNNAVKLNGAETSLKAYDGTSFPITLTWNDNFIADTVSTDNTNNGYNFIGFPFDPSKYNRVAFTSSRVLYGNEIYETIGDAAAAGIIDQHLFTVDATGQLVAVSSNDLSLRPYRAYFVRILRHDQPVTLVLRNPSN